MNDYPFTQELITDTQGNISKVIINFDDYQEILSMLEDMGLYRAMQETTDETPMSKEEALKKLDS